MSFYSGNQGNYPSQQNYTQQQPSYNPSYVQQFQTSQNQQQQQQYSPYSQNSYNSQPNTGGTYSYGSSQSLYQDPQMQNLQYTQYQQTYQGYSQGYGQQPQQQTFGYQQNVQKNICPQAVKCTFVKSGKNHFDQYWYNCLDCDYSESKGVCPCCAVVCHQGHKLSSIKYGKFFCDCGAGALKCKCECL